MDPASHCYCGASTHDASMIECRSCHRWFHPGCMLSGSPSSLVGDIFFLFTCNKCSPEGEEEVLRMKLQWLQVVMLTLYNLHLSEAGKRGYFRWKDHICSYIDKHWLLFFGPTRKKTSTWFGTVAGTLSSGCPEYFQSGAVELKENGWWKLSEYKPPGLETLTNAKPVKRVKQDTKEPAVKVEGLRVRRSKTSFVAAMELKAKRAMTVEAKEMRRRRSHSGGHDTDQSSSESPSFSGLVPMETSPTPASSSSMSETGRPFTPTLKNESFSASDDSNLHVPDTPERKRHGSAGVELMEQESQMSTSSAKSDRWLTEKDLTIADMVPQNFFEEEDDMDSDFEVDPCSITPPYSPVTENMTASLPPMEDILHSLSDHRRVVSEDDHSTSGPSFKNAFPPEFKQGLVHMKTDQEEDELSHTDVTTSAELTSRTYSSQPARLSQQTEDMHAGDADDESEAESEAQSHTTSEGSAEITKSQKHVEIEEKTQVPVKKCVPMSVYEEKQLLKKLNALSSSASNPEINRLRRKLVIRQLKRERGLPLFNLDMEIVRLIGEQGSLDKELSSINQSLNPQNVPTGHSMRDDYRVLDRYQTTYYSSVSHRQQPVTFLNRLVGTDDDQLTCSRSPYTARMLKPFIRRDYETRPLKLRLYEEIIAYAHKDDTTWEPASRAPIDYCYVRPQHIPSVNAFCREFFWPGIDLSECLQYPDFTCVVLYRKFVIGFAFLVPDVKYNEAYIPFIFTHPEWRKAGIASFMLYHLIQTCMGKDVTLHVSASNPAMMLYQKFAFKPEEFIVDFYDKYFAADSKECKHAFFLRLRR